MPRRFGPSRRDIARARAIDALADMRRTGVTLRDAARRHRTTPRTVQKYLPNALRRARGGRIVATSSDRYVRRIKAIVPEGLREVSVAGSRVAARVAAHRAAVVHYLETGDARALRAFHGETFRAGKERLPFITDESLLKRLGHQGEIAFEELYASIG